MYPYPNMPEREHMQAQVQTPAQGQPMQGGMRQGWLDYLTAQGWNGEGRPWQYAQSLRQQGMHPRWDYNHPGVPWPGVAQGGNGGGQLGQGGGLAGLFGQWGQNPTPRPMQPQGWTPGAGPQMGGTQPPQGYDGSGINPGGMYSGGLQSLAARRPVPILR